MSTVTPLQTHLKLGVHHCHFCHTVASLKLFHPQRSVLNRTGVREATEKVNIIIVQEEKRMVQIFINKKFMRKTETLWRISGIFPFDEGTCSFTGLADFTKPKF